MRSIDSSVMAQLEAGELRPFALLDIELDGTHYRYTDCDVPIIYSSNSYAPRGFSGEPIGYSVAHIVDQCGLEVDNLDDALTSAFVGGNPQGEPVLLLLVVVTASGTIIGTPVTLFDGAIDSWSIHEEKVQITLVNDLIRWSLPTLSLYSASCRWKKFKGTYCGYSGSATWCDRTYARCQALSNTDNFGGFRWLPSMVDKVVWWGRESAWE
jgi:hypothetical protein